VSSRRWWRGGGCPRDLGGVAFQDLYGLGGDPALGVEIAGLEETPAGLPQIFMLSTGRE
jgi:hypothetical protein